MADIYYCQEDPDEESENAYSDPNYGGVNPNAGLTPLEKMEKYASANNILNRQMVPRIALETLRQVVGDPSDVELVFTILERLAEDLDCLIRSELMEQVPHIAIYCQEVPDHLGHAVPHHLLPLVVKFLVDNNHQVRKTSQAALLVLLEQGLVHKSDVEQQVCPVILEFTEITSEDYRIEATALLSKMAPMIGREMSERLFLDRFAKLCTDPVFHVRKVCAANFGDFCGVVGPEATEKILLPKFYALCTDNIWGVRKCCADVFMPVSCICSPEVRKVELSPLFIGLLRDNSRWVRMAAFQALGPFISTFADPAITALLHNENGEIIITDREQLVHKLNVLEEQRAKEAEVLAAEKAAAASAAVDTKEAAAPAESSEGDSSESDNLSISSDQETGAQQNSSSTSEETTRDLSTAALENTLNNNPNTLAEEPTSTSTADNDDSENSVNNNIVAMDESTDEGNNEVNYTAVPANNLQQNESENVHKQQQQQTSFEEKRASLYYSNNTKTSSLADNSDYSSFLYWREPVQPVLDQLVEVDLTNTDEHEDKPTETGTDEEYILNKLSDFVNKDCSERLKTVDVSGGEEEKGAVEQQEKKEEQESADKEEEDSDSLPDVENVQQNQQFNNSESGSQEGSSMEMYGSASDKESADNICTFEPGIQWGSFSSLKMSRNSPGAGGEGDSAANKDAPLDPALPRGPPETDQNIVPQLLIDHYVSMIDPSRVQTVESDIARHCAFSFPAVALTLGRANWPLLKETYETLANDMQWKVRRTLASSIHELAVILGEEVAAQDLVPIFNGFIKDLDEVRIGILKHLSSFLGLLDADQRRQYLPKMEEFLKMDNERNWRFRLELAHQLGQLGPVFEAQDIREHLAPIALTLIQDKVAEVRTEATQVICGMLLTQDQQLNNFLVQQIIEKMVSCSHWTRRQTFSSLCTHLVHTIQYQHFSQDFLPHLLKLTEDRVPNVRIQVARVLGQSLPSEYFDDVNLADREAILESLTTLAADRDADVREAACALGRVQPVPPPEPENQHTEDEGREGEEGEGDSTKEGEDGDEGERGEGDGSSSSGTGGDEEGKGEGEGPVSWAQIAAK